MDPETVVQVFTIAREVTTTGLLIGAIYGLLTGKVVTRFHYDEMQRSQEQRIARLKKDSSH